MLLQLALITSNLMPRRQVGRGLCCMVVYQFQAVAQHRCYLLFT